MSTDPTPRGDAGAPEIGDLKSGVSGPWPVSAALVSALLVLLVGLLAWGAGGPCLAPPLGVTAYLCARRPHELMSAPRSIALGHAVGILAGWLAASIVGLGPDANALAGPFTLGHAVASALAIGLTVLFTEGLRSPHPPAGATTLVVSLGLLRDPADIAAFGAGTAALVIYAAVRRGVGQGTPGGDPKAA